MGRPVMPDPIGPVDRYGRMCSPDASREECMVDVDFDPTTLLDNKMVDEDAPGTRGDETGIAAGIIQRDVAQDRDDPGAG